MVFDFIHVVGAGEVERGGILVIYSYSIIADHRLVVDSVIPLLLCLVLKFEIDLFIYVLFQRGDLGADENRRVLRYLIVIIVNRAL